MHPVVRNWRLSITCLVALVAHRSGLVDHIVFVLT